MKTLHRPDLFCWSRFDKERNIDFNSYVWVRQSGNVVVDPLPLSKHDRSHLDELGGAAWIVITNSDHVRDALAVADHTGAKIVGPAAEKETLGVSCARWLDDGDEVVPGMRVIALDGSKTPGELALQIDDTLITGDLVRGQNGGSLNALPGAKLKDAPAAKASIAALAERDVTAVLVGDGWPVFSRGREALAHIITTWT